MEDFELSKMAFDYYFKKDNNLTAHVTVRKFAPNDLQPNIYLI